MYASLYPASSQNEQVCHQGPAQGSVYACIDMSRGMLDQQQMIDLMGRSVDIRCEFFTELGLGWSPCHSSGGIAEAGIVSNYQ